MEKTNTYRFEVVGLFKINKDLKTLRAFDGTPMGFMLPDGRSVRLSVALEIASADGLSHDHVTREAAMAELGFECTEYKQTDFVSVGEEENEDYVK